MIKILVDRLSEGPETLEVNCLPSELGIESEAAYEFSMPVTGAVEFNLIGRDVQGSGALRTEVKTQCVRCLAPITVPIEVPVEAVWLFHDPTAHDYKEPAPEEILAEYHKGDIIYPADTLRELILTEIPDFPLCKEECKGLCPGCGANLNVEPCTCKKSKAVDSTPEAAADWKAKLKQLKLGD